HLSESRAQALLRRGLGDKAPEVRAQAMAETARRLVGALATPETAGAWADLIATSSDLMTDEPRLARTMASALAWVRAADTRLGRPPRRLQTSPLVARALLDLQLEDADEARLVVSELLRNPHDDLALERVNAALRLNDRRPKRLRLDEAPSHWDANAAAQLDA